MGRITHRTRRMRNVWKCQICERIIDFVERILRSSRALLTACWYCSQIGAVKISAMTRRKAVGESAHHVESQALPSHSRDLGTVRRSCDEPVSGLFDWLEHKSLFATFISLKLFMFTISRQLDNIVNKWSSPYDPHHVFLSRNNPSSQSTRTPPVSSLPSTASFSSATQYRSEPSR